MIEKCSNREVIWLLLESVAGTLDGFRHFRLGEGQFATLHVIEAANCIDFTTHASQFGGLKAVTLTETPPKRLHLARLYALLLCDNKLSFTTRKRIQFIRQTMAAKPFISDSGIL